jgi:hypothetical protein
MGDIPTALQFSFISEEILTGGERRYKRVEKRILPRLTT